MDRFSIDDVRGPFQADMRGALDALQAHLSALVDAEGIAIVSEAAAERRSLAEAAEDGCHTVMGSSSLVGAVGLTAGAGALRLAIAELDAAWGAVSAALGRARAAEAVAASILPSLDRLLELELAGDRAGADSLAASLPGAPAPAQAPMAPEAPLPAPVVAQEPPAPATPEPSMDGILREAFASEAGELLDALDSWALEIEQAVPGPERLNDLMRHYHTLKGSAATVGMLAISRVAHRLEDVIEGLGADPAAAPRPDLGALLLRVQPRLRSWLASDPAPAELDAELAAVEAWICAGSAASEPTAPAPIAPLPLPLPVVAVGATEDDEAGGGVRQLRVAASQLDALMGLAGELVQGRARLDVRVGELQRAGGELRVSRDHLTHAVDAFRERFEFAGLDGAAPTSEPRPGRFSALELDHYDDVHILARSLAEVGNDIALIQSRISSAIGTFGEDAERLGRTVGAIQESVTTARLVPLGRLFTRLRLAVRDAAAHVGCAVRVVVDGEDVPLDRAIGDGLSAPLLHLVRNAVVHGIARAGRPGVVSLSARQESGQVVITVADDGAGLDLVKLQRMGVARGLIAAGTPVESDAVRELVFSAGLSTVADADAVSGRGFGCDVAHRAVHRLGGTITVTSVSGRGTTFTIVLPAMLAITRALLIRQGGRPYGVPLAFVERILDPGATSITNGVGGRRIASGGGTLVLTDLGVALGEAAGPATGGAALVVRIGHERRALRVDGLQGQADVVIGGLGELLAGHPLFAGVTVSGTGELVPLLDLAGVFSSRPRPALAPGPVALAAAPAGRRRVLVADDSVSVRTALERQLAALGWEVLLAVDGEDALARLRAERVDLVLTDLEMPRLTGYDLLREIRLNPALQAIPVVVVTSRSGDKHRRLAEELGADGYLPKPFTSEQLAAAVAIRRAR